jgi:hypothetical protein
MTIFKKIVQGFLQTWTKMINYWGQLKSDNISSKIKMSLMFLGQIFGRKTKHLWHYLFIFFVCGHDDAKICHHKIN